MFVLPLNSRYILTTFKLIILNYIRTTIAHEIKTQIHNDMYSLYQKYRSAYLVNKPWINIGIKLNNADSP